MKTQYRQKSAERGEAEIMLFVTILVICGLISAALYGVGFMRQKKAARSDRYQAAIAARRTPAPFAPPLDPGEYYATCERKGWAPFAKNTSCDVLEESYREYDAMP